MLSDMITAQNVDWIFGAIHALTSIRRKLPSMDQDPCAASYLPACPRIHRNPEAIPDRSATASGTNRSLCRADSL
jgi:hypothetical protein